MTQQNTALMQITTRLRHSFRIACGAMLLFALNVSIAPAASQDPSENKTHAWQAVKNGEAVAIMRHAIAPGMGDPPEFVIGQCDTQRNLSDEGRRQSARIGQLLKSEGIESATVVSSQWCRCEETAQLLDIGTVTTDAMLNSFFQNRATAEQQTRQLETSIRLWIKEREGPRILVSHQVNISALTGEFTRSGEILIVTLKNDELQVMHRESH